MSVLYALIFAIIILILYYPYFKQYQLEGYIITEFAQNFLFYKYSFKGKNRLIFTKRMIRFIGIFAFLLFTISHIVFILEHSVWMILFYLLLFGILSPIVFILAHIFIYPIEVFIKKFYIARTKKKLHDFKGIKIAITGSYGKTTVKNILTHLLGKKFKVIASPKNYNTPMGVCKTVSCGLDEAQIAIFEMGARNEGDIKELMELIDPDIGVMTSIGEQHLESFGSLTNIIRTKNELVKYIQGQGKIFFDGENENSFELYKKCSKNKALTCNEKGMSFYSDVRYSQRGMTFTMRINDKTEQVQTKLLGKFNCKNIVIAASVARYLGVSFEDIVDRIKTLEPVKNRLELIDMKSFMIIDDSYNANEEGVKESLNVLSRFSGRKIVITSGLVEMGSIQYEKNYILGKEISKSANMVVIMNETNKNAILAGLKETGFPQDKIFYANTREEEIEIIKKINCPGSVILFQNDLPDNYK